MRVALLARLSTALLLVAAGCNGIGGRGEFESPEQALAAERAASAAFLEKAAGQTGAVQTPAGVVIRELRIGSGPQPGPRDSVSVRYQTRLRSGKRVDSSERNGDLLTLPLDRAIPCWSEALPRLRAGGVAELTCPASLAYGDVGVPPLIAPGAALAYEVELVDVGRPLPPKGH
jgi:FKBP-type peptidyl-prolyl cis-trans isomerase FkpA